MVNFIKKNLFVLFFPLFIFLFYLPVIINGKIPIASDTIIGLYHPYRDFYSENYPRGYPFKNFLITDPVRQTYIWKEISISLIKKGQLPVWNPYEMSGKPLLANFQSGVFYPLNIILLFNPFHRAWSIFIVMQSILGGAFIFLLLKEYNLKNSSSILGSIAFTFSGFFVAWLEWGNIGNTIIWLPLEIFVVEKLFKYLSVDKYRNFSYLKSFPLIFEHKLIIWNLLFLFSLVSSFFSGHLQVFFYSFLVLVFYIFAKLYISNNKKVIVFNFLKIFFLFLFITFIQWYPTFQFINLSARSIDQNYLMTEGFFIPISHLIQFLAPDFFGNPVTLNYWGTWNYGELIGFVGIIPLFFAFFGISFVRSSKKILFFTLIIIFALIFSTDNFIARMPFYINIPIISTAQPTRLLSVACFGLAVLSAIGFDIFLKLKNRRRILVLSIVFMIITFSVWAFVFSISNLFIDKTNIEIAKRNFVFPTALILLIVLLTNLSFLIKKTMPMVSILIILFVGIDLLRFGSKFNVFENKSFLYPNTAVLNFLKDQKGFFRITSLDNRILPPNFLTYYRLQTIEGYDPLYLKSYGQFIAALERDEPNIKEPFGFNRIITVSNFKSQLFDFLNVKYVLSLDKIESDKLKLVFEEGQTKIYQNLNFFPRVYFAEEVITAINDEDAVSKIFSKDLSRTAVLSGDVALGNRKFTKGKVEIDHYSENEVILSTSNISDGFVVFSDSYYPSWHVKIDGVESEIIRTNLSFRGLFVPAGNHKIKFYPNIY